MTSDTGRVLVTGCDGFTGRYLASALAERGHEVHGMSRREPPAEPVAGVLQWHRCSLLDVPSLELLVDRVRPDFVVHLAAVSFIAHADVAEMYATNVVGTRNLLSALAVSKHMLRRVLVASSANVYGNASSGAISETAPVAPANDYAISKLAGEHVVGLFRDQLPLVVTRPFNYTGRGQSNRFLLPKLIDHFRSRKRVIELGNTDIARDFSDVRYVVERYCDLVVANTPTGAIYNVCSAQAYTLRSVLSMLELMTGHALEIRIDPRLVRFNEVRSLWGDRAKLDQLLGAPDPAVPTLEATLEWMLETP